MYKNTICRARPFLFTLLASSTVGPTHTEALVARFGVGRLANLYANVPVAPFKVVPHTCQHDIPKDKHEELGQLVQTRPHGTFDVDKSHQLPYQYLCRKEIRHHPMRMVDALNHTD